MKIKSNLYNKLLVPLSEYFITWAYINLYPQLIFILTEIFFYKTITSFECIISVYKKNSLFKRLFMISDLNPAAQGSSLTEGKRAKRSKKHEVNGDGRGSPNGEDEPDGEIQVPEKKKDIEVTIIYQMYSDCMSIKWKI